MKLLKIGFTHGDINGVSYEMLLKVLQDPELLELCTPVIFGSAAVAQVVASHIGAEMPSFHIIDQADQVIDGAINLVAVCREAEPEVVFGQQTEAALQAEALSLTAAIDAYSHHHLDALITLPGHLNNTDGSHSLTDFICRALDVSPDETFEWMLAGSVRSLVIQHSDVSTQLGEGLVAETLQQHITAISNSLRQDFGIMRPRLAVISSNARLHADLSDLRDQGIFAFGPFVSSVFLDGVWQQHYDGCIFLNDEASSRSVLSQAVSTDLVDAPSLIGYISGLPLVLAYPLQDISYDIAGQGQASEVPLRQAIYSTLDFKRHRFHYHIATRRPLEKQWVPRGRDDFKLDLTKEE